MNGKEIDKDEEMPPLPVDEDNPEERQPNPVEAEMAVNPELIDVEGKEPA
jgi:hypothetical protein